MKARQASERECAMSGCYGAEESIDEHEPVKGLDTYKQGWNSSCDA